MAQKRILRTKNNQRGLTAVGLGNPGDEYSRTRHNVGFQVLDIVATRLNLSFKKPLFRNVEICSSLVEDSFLFLAKPLTYMNRTGTVIPYIGRRSGHASDQSLVVCDTLDLPVGTLRLKKGGSTGGHRGISSIISVTGESDFLRMYIGIGRPESKSDVIDYVLGVPDADEQELLNVSLEKAANGIVRLLSDPPQQIMNELNARNRN